MTVTSSSQPDHYPLAHRRQQHGYGCSWHALYAITHDENLLDHIHVTSDHWRVAHLAQTHTLTPYTLYNGLFTVQPAPPEFWTALRPAIGLAYAPLLLVVPVGRTLHEIAVSYPHEGSAPEVLISDSLQNDRFTLPLDWFHAHPIYGRAYLVRELTSLDPAEHDPLDITTNLKRPWAALEATT